MFFSWILSEITPEKIRALMEDLERGVISQGLDIILRAREDGVRLECDVAV